MGGAEAENLKGVLVIDREWAKRFAEEWIDAWNSHDLERMGLTQSFRAVSMVALVLISGCALMHKRPPYQDPDRLVRIIKVAPPAEDEPSLGIDFLEYRNQSQTLAPIAAYQSQGFALTGGAPPERIFSGIVSADFFPLLGVRPLLGRTFLPEERQPGKHQVVVASYDLWQRRFGGNPGLIGSTITLDQEKYTVIGIMPSDFRFPKECEIWMPLAYDDENLRLEDKSVELDVIARLKPGVTLRQSEAEMSVIANKLEKDHPETNRGRGVKLTPLSESRRQKARVMEMKIRRPAN